MIRCRRFAYTAAALSNMMRCAKHKINSSDLNQQSIGRGCRANLPGPEIFATSTNAGIYMYAIRVWPCHYSYFALDATSTRFYSCNYY